ncbi:hypothetical protein HERIO_2413 [Hepatospora eriocheir]|uniref:Uncharacterized protein n=1 Tax=Hepatospora eriocheir TaxID=1081669 RepID=A0A1X0Q715_9MICR|nr:hypothetical protein HERIO_2413 [Hepatospora eriocheir]
MVYVKRLKNERFNERFMTLTIKYSGKLLIILDCFSSKSVRNCEIIKENMDRLKYTKILKIYGLNKKIKYGIKLFIITIQ